MKDLLIEEIRKYRDEHAKKFNYDLDAICVDYMKKQKESGKPLVSLEPKKLNKEKK